MHRCRPAHWVENDQFQRRMLQEGKSLEDMQRFDYIACTCLPDSGRSEEQRHRRSEEQRHLRAGSFYSSTDQGVPLEKLVFYAHCEVEPLRILRLNDEVGSVPIGFTYLGAFLPPRLYADIVMFTPETRRVLTFDGEVCLDGTTGHEVVEEIKHIIDDSIRGAEVQAATSERLAEQNRQVTAHNQGTPNGSPAAAAPMYSGYIEARWEERNNRSRGNRGGRYSQAEWDEWNRSRRY